MGAFNVSDLEQTQAVIQAAVHQRSPVIINTSEKAIEYAGLEELAALVIAMAKKYPVPIVLNLDHGHDVRLANRCLGVGYSGLMFDGSRHPYRKNIQLTRKVVNAAKRRGIGVEGELGQVKYAFEYRKDPSLVLTDPNQAQDFVRQTGVAALAVAIGNAHGVPMPNERLHFSVLRAVRQKVSVPLVLHGASSTPPASIRKAVSLGICKINIDTDLRISFSRGVRKALTGDRTLFDPRTYLNLARQHMMQVVEKDMVLFGSARKATR